MADVQKETPTMAKRTGTFASRLATWGAAVSLPILGLANLSEAVLLVEEGVDKVVSTFTHLPEYDDLSQLKVGTTREFVEHVFAMPQVRKSLGEGLSADYYFDDKYLLTVLMKDDEVHGYTVLSLNPDFHPDFVEDRDKTYSLGEFTFGSTPGLARDFRVDWTKTLGLYLEELDLGLQSLGKTAYLGRLSYGANTSDASGIGRLYNAKLLDDKNTLEQTRPDVRSNLVPNLFGWGNLSLETVKASFLTTSQFGNYAPAYQ